MERILKKRCTICGNTVVAMGSARANGKTGLTDWDNRPMHKKCLKQHQKDLEFEHRMQDIMETQQTANKSLK